MGVAGPPSAGRALQVAPVRLEDVPSPAIVAVSTVKAGHRSHPARLSSPLAPPPIAAALIADKREVTHHELRMNFLHRQVVDRRWSPHAATLCPAPKSRQNRPVSAVTVRTAPIPLSPRNDRPRADRATRIAGLRHVRRRVVLLARPHNPALT